MFSESGNLKENFVLSPQFFRSQILVCFDNNLLGSFFSRLIILWKIFFTWLKLSLPSNEICQLNFVFIVFCSFDPFSLGFLFESALDRNKHKDLAFSLLLKQKTDVFLSPKGILDIPICFAPEAMILHEATCFVHVRKTDGSGFDGYDRRPSYSSNREMRWVFTIKGVPESRPVKDARAPILQCKARERLEEKLELCFTGINPSISKSTHTPYIRSMAPMNLLGGYLVPSTPDLDVDYVNLPEEFKCEFEYASTEGEMALERSVGLGLIRKMKHKISGIVTLIFNVVFSPFKPFE